MIITNQNILLIYKTIQLQSNIVTMTLSVILYVQFTVQCGSTSSHGHGTFVTSELKKKTGTATMWPALGLMINYLKEKKFVQSLV